MDQTFNYTQKLIVEIIFYLTIAENWAIIIIEYCRISDNIRYEMFSTELKIFTWEV